MKPILVIVGLVVLLMGAAWALQGAYLLPATFMRGPSWIGIGTAVALVGFLIVYLGWRGKSPPKAA
jgi:hypothetical protein